MSKRTVLLLTMTAMLVFTVAPVVNVAFAAEEGAGAGAAATGPAPWATVGTALALGLAASLCGLGQAWSISAACQGIARNPGAAGAIRLAMLLGLAFIESLVIYVLVIAFLKG